MRLTASRVRFPVAVYGSTPARLATGAVTFTVTARRAHACAATRGAVGSSGARLFQHARW